MRRELWALVLMAVTAAGCGGGASTGAPQQPGGAPGKSGNASGAPGADSAAAKASVPSQQRPDQLAADAFPDLSAGIAALRSAAGDRDNAKVLGIAQWLQTHHGEAAIGPCRDLLLDSSADPTARIAACMALRSLGPAAAPALIAGADADVETVAANSVKSLTALRPVAPGLLDQLMRWIDHPAPNVRRAAIQSLAIIGTKAESCAPKLVEILNDPAADEMLRGEAKRALKAINPRRTFQD